MQIATCGQWLVASGQCFGKHCLKGEKGSNLNEYVDSYTKFFLWKWVENKVKLSFKMKSGYQINILYMLNWLSIMCQLYLSKKFLYIKNKMDDCFARIQ